MKMNIVPISEKQDAIRSVVSKAFNCAFVKGAIVRSESTATRTFPNSSRRYQQVIIPGLYDRGRGYKRMVGELEDTSRYEGCA